MMAMVVDREGRVRLPAEVRRALGVGEQSETWVLLRKTDRGTYEMVPASAVPDDQRWFWHPEMAERTAQAEADFRDGRASRARTPAEAMAILDGLKRTRS